MIKLKIIAFNLPECHLCGCGGLEVYDGETHNSPLIGRYCGSGWEEDELVFGGSAAYLEYDSYSYPTEDPGFRIEYQFFDTARKSGIGTDPWFCRTCIEVWETKL